MKKIMKYSLGNIVKVNVIVMLVIFAVAALGEFSFAVVSPQVFGENLSSLSFFILFACSLIAGAGLCKEILCVGLSNSVSRKTCMAGMLVTLIIAAFVLSAALTVFESVSVAVINSVAGTNMQRLAAFAGYVSYSNQFVSALACIGFNMMISAIIMLLITLFYAVFYRFGAMAYFVCYLAFFIGMSFLGDTILPKLKSYNIDFSHPRNLTILLVCVLAVIAVLTFLLLRRVSADKLAGKKSYTSL